MGFLDDAVLTEEQAQPKGGFLDDAVIQEPSNQTQGGFLDDAVINDNQPIQSTQPQDQPQGGFLDDAVVNEPEKEKPNKLSGLMSGIQSLISPANALANTVQAPEDKGLIQQNISDYWKNKLDRFNRQDLIGKGMEVAGTGLDAYTNTLGKLGSANTAGILAKARGEGDYFDTLGKEILYGNQNKQLSRDWNNGNPAETSAGAFGRGAADLGFSLVTDPFVGLGGIGKILGKLGKVGKATDTVANLAKGAPAANVSRNLFQNIAKAGHDALQPAVKTLGGIENKVFNEPVKKIFDGLGSTAKLAYKGVDRLDDIFNNGRLTGIVEKVVNDYLVPTVRKIPEQTRQLFQGPKGNMNSTSATIEQTGNLARDLAYKLSPNAPEETLKKLTQSIINKDLNAPITVAYKNIGDNLARRMDALEKPLLDATGFDLAAIRNNWDRGVIVPRGTYALSPTSGDPDVLKKIIVNLNKQSGEFVAAGNQDMAYEAKALADYFQSRLTNKGRDYMAPAYVGTKLNKNSVVSKFIKSMEETQGGIVKGDWLHERLIPDELVKSFEPQQSIEGFLDYWQGVNRDVTALEMLANYGKAHPESIKKVASKLPKNLANELDLSDLPKPQADDIRAIQSDILSKANSMIDEYAPTFPSADMPDIVKQHMNEVLGRFDPNYQSWLDKAGTPGKVWKAYTKFFKNNVLRDIEPVMRNQFEFIAAGLPHGEDVAQHFANQKLYLDFIKGQKTGYSPEMRDVMGKIFGGNAGSIINELNKSALDADNLDILEMGLKGIQKLSKDNKAVVFTNNVLRKYMNEMAYQLTAPDMATRMSLFENQLKKITGTDLQSSLSNKEAVNQALRFVEDNTIQYESLPKLVQWIREAGFQPFMSYMWQAPARNFKAFMANPSQYTRIQDKLRQVSQMNLEKEDDEFRDVFDKRQNKLANMLSPFGADVNLGRYGDANEFATYSTAALNPFTTGQKFANYGKTGTQQAIDTGLQYFGLGGEQTPMTPAGVLGNINLMTEDPDAFWRSVQLMNVPKVIPNIANVGIGAGALDKFPTIKEKASNIISGGQRAPTLGRSLLKILGQKIKPNDIPQFMESKEKFTKQYDDPAINYNIERRLKRGTPDGTDPTSDTEMLKQITKSETYKAEMALWRMGLLRDKPEKPR